MKLKNMINPLPICYQVVVPFAEMELNVIQVSKIYFKVPKISVKHSIEETFSSKDTTWIEYHYFFQTLNR